MLLSHAELLCPSTRSWTYNYENLVVTPAVVQGDTQMQGSATMRCNSLIFITQLVTLKDLAP